MLSIQASLNNGIGYYRVDSFVITRENTDNCHDRYSPVQGSTDRQVRRLIGPTWSQIFKFLKTWSVPVINYSNLFGLGLVLGAAWPKPISSTRGSLVQSFTNISD